MAISDFLLDDTDDAEGGGFAESGEEKEETPPQPEQQDSQQTAESAQPDPVQRKLLVMEEQIRLLHAQNEELKKRPAEEKKQDYNYEPATQDDWAEDPNKAFEKNLKASLAKIQAEHQKIKGEQAEQANQRLAQYHERAWQQVVNTVPAFANDPDMRKAFAAVFHNPANNYKNDPNGPIAAAAEIVNRLGLAQRTPGSTASIQSAAETQSLNAQQGNPRTARVKAGAMHGSGRGGGQKVKSLDPEYMRVAKRLGLSEEAMRSAVESEAA